MSRTLLAATTALTMLVSVIDRGGVQVDDVIARLPAAALAAAGQ